MANPTNLRDTGYIRATGAGSVPSSVAYGSTLSSSGTTVTASASDFTKAMRNGYIHAGGQVRKIRSWTSATVVETDVEFDPPLSSDSWGLIEERDCGLSEFTIYTPSTTPPTICLPLSGIQDVDQGVGITFNHGNYSCFAYDATGSLLLITFAK